ncbi:putative leucine-rich repeat-containing protein DDB_G0290503 [Vespa mandarinia]|uniref:putative leucine-rich repeat-containing protein DDB_G0290503 n=1 Tax=Vespa mandarinia TaxID=7446 RepID=UPI00161F6663|nr:putative leucine-rich repeat-containing protein DDB_G0290503 [Vespa mandarinia]
MQSEENKRKGDFLHHTNSPEKIRKVGQTSSRFVDTLIGQWSKHTGMQISSMQVKDYKSSIDETEQTNNQDLKIQILQKKLQEAEDNIITLSTNLESELSIKDEISEKLTSTWESIDTITNYCNYMSESMKTFQEHINHLTTLYNTIIDMQKNTVERQEQQLYDMKTKDADHQKYISQVEENLVMQEKKIQELISIKHILEEEAKSYEEKLSFEKNYLISLHTEEKLKLIKEHEIVINEKDQLQLSIKQMEEKTKNTVDLITEKEICITKLQEEINSYINQITVLSSQNTELIENIEKLEKEKEKEAQEKANEVKQLLEVISKNKAKENELTEGIGQKMELCRYLENNLLDTKNKLEQAGNTIKNLKSNENVTIINLQKAIETLQKEKAEMYTEYQTQIQHIKQSEKKVQEKREATLKEEFKITTTKMKNTIEQLKEDITKLHEALEEAKAENNMLRNKGFEIKENNNKLKKSVSNISKYKEKNQTESELENKYTKYQKELDLAEQKYRSIQAKLDKQMETQLDILKIPPFSHSQSQNNKKLQNIKDKEELFNELQKSSSQQTPTQMFSVIASQDKITEMENSPGEKKFFKLRNTQVRRYGNQKNKIIRT